MHIKIRWAVYGIIVSMLLAGCSSPETGVGDKPGAMGSPEEIPDRTNNSSLLSSIPFLYEYQDVTYSIDGDQVRFVSSIDEQTLTIEARISDWKATLDADLESNTVENLHLINESRSVVIQGAVPLLSLLVNFETPSSAFFPSLQTALHLQPLIVAIHQGKEIDQIPGLQSHRVVEFKNDTDLVEIRLNIDPYSSVLIARLENSSFPVRSHFSSEPPRTWKYEKTSDLVQGSRLQKVLHMSEATECVDAEGWDQIPEFSSGFAFTRYEIMEALKESQKYADYLELHPDAYATMMVYEVTRHEVKQLNEYHWTVHFSSEGESNGTIEQFIFQAKKNNVTGVEILHESERMRSGSLYEHLDTASFEEFRSRAGHFTDFLWTLEYRGAMYENGLIAQRPSHSGDFAAASAGVEVQYDALTGCEILHGNFTPAVIH